MIIKTTTHNPDDELFSTIFFEKTLAKIINSSQSLEDIESWLKMQCGVKKVQLANYILKSNPPQRVFIMELKMDNHKTVKKILSIFDLGNQKFLFHKLQDE